MRQWSGALAAGGADEEDAAAGEVQGPTGLPQHLMLGPSRPAPDAGPSRKYKPPVGGRQGPRGGWGR